MPMARVNSVNSREPTCVQFIDPVGGLPSP